MIGVELTALGLRHRLCSSRLIISVLKRWLSLGIVPLSVQDEPVACGGVYSKNAKAGPLPPSPPDAAYPEGKSYGRLEMNYVPERGGESVNHRCTL